MSGEFRKRTQPVAQKQLVVSFFLSEEKVERAVVVEIGEERSLSLPPEDDSDLRTYFLKTEPEEAFVEVAAVVGQIHYHHIQESIVINVSHDRAEYSSSPGGNRQVSLKSHAEFYAELW